jgi:hypothetical protein
MPGSLLACALDARRKRNVASATDLTALPELVAGAVLLSGMPCFMINSFVKVERKTASTSMRCDTAGLLVYKLKAYSPDWKRLVIRALYLV